MDVAEFDRVLLAWFDASGRSLALRSRRDPYAVLVGEVMAQQTQIGRVGPAWERFLERFPTIDALAAATPAAVLRAWSGLGYNRRALNLQRAARIVVEEHDGELPSDVERLEQLPGVGRYTARAVAAIAFGSPVAAIDTNVRRVVGRVVAGHGRPADAGHPLTDGELQATADALVDRDRPGDWTHAMMDVGAGPCRPREPECDACPLRTWCRFALTRTPERSVEGGRAVRRSVPRAPALARSPAPPATPSAPFELTRRWLRGRLLARLTEAPDGEWTVLRDGIGRHGPDAVESALEALATEGLVERDADGRVRLPV